MPNTTHTTAPERSRMSTTRKAAMIAGVAYIDRARAIYFAG